MGVCAGSQKYDLNQKLSQNEIKVITETWKLVVKSGLSKHGTNLMVKIFIEHKEMKPLWRFSRNLETEEQMNSNQTLKAHGEKLFNAIDMAVNSIHDLSAFLPILFQLGCSHHKWGVKEEQFEIIGGVLLETLHDALKEKFTTRVKLVWAKFFYILSSQMKNGIRQQIENENQKLVNKQNIDIQLIDGDVAFGNVVSNGNTNKVFPDCGNI